MNSNPDPWRIAGVDMSAQPNKTALAYFEFGHDGRIELHQEPGPRDRSSAGTTVTGVTDERLTKVLGEPRTLVGIDAPLGWPTDFVTAVNAWNSTPRRKWEGKQEGFRNFKFRDTDNKAQRHDEVGRARDWPNGYSVAADKIAVTTFRTLACVMEAYDDPAEVDITGDTGRLIEVWPGASLAALNIPSKGYKKNSSGLVVREGVAEEIKTGLSKLGARFDMKTFENEGLGVMVKTDHALDAVIAAITAWAALVDKTDPPPTEGEERARAQREGWIHVPTGDSTLEQILSIDPLPQLRKRLE